MKMRCRFRILFVMLLGLLVSSQLFVYGQSHRGSRRRKTATSVSARKQPPESEPSASAAVPYVSADGRFKVGLPRPFIALEKSGEQSAVTPYGELITVVTLESKVKTGRSYSHCIITYIDYPERIFTEMSPPQIFRSAQQGTLGSLPAPVTLSEEKFNWFPATGVRVPTARHMTMSLYWGLKFSQAPGLTTFIKTTDAAGTHYMRFDILITRPRVYSIALVYQNRARFEEDDAKGFFDSFRLTEAD